MKIKLLTLLLVPFLLIGCGNKVTISDERPKTGNIVIIGDSITAGFGVAESERYTTLLQNMLRDQAYPFYNIVNLGVNGDTTTDGLGRFNQVSEARPEIIVVALGGNDFLQGESLEIVSENLRQMLEQGQDVGADMVLVGVIAPPTRGFGYSIQASEMYKLLADEFEVRLIPNVLKGLVLDQRYMLDQVHPNALGHQKIASVFLETLEPILRK